MAENRLPRAHHRLFAQADAMLRACEKHHGEIGLKHNPPARIERALAAARQTEYSFQTARARQLKATAHRRTIDDAAWDFIVRARDVLKHYLGSQCSQRWEPIGFPNYSLRVPQKVDQRLYVLQKLTSYLRANPLQANAQLEVTSERAGKLYQELLAAGGAINHGDCEAHQCRQARDAAVAILRKTMRGLIRELGMLIAKDDPRWIIFNLNQPALRRRHKGTKTHSETSPAASPLAAREPVATNDQTASAPTTTHEPTCELMDTDHDAVVGRPTLDLVKLRDNSALLPLDLADRIAPHRLLAVLAFSARPVRKKSFFDWFFPSLN